MVFTETTHQCWVQEEHLCTIHLFFVNEKSTVTDDKENQVHFLKPDWLCDSHEIKDFSDEHNHIPISWTDFTNRQYYFIPMIDLLMSKKMVTRVKTVADTSVREIPSWEMFKKSSCRFCLFFKIQIFFERTRPGFVKLKCVSGTLYINGSQKFNFLRKNFNK